MGKNCDIRSVDQWVMELEILFNKRRFMLALFMPALVLSVLLGRGLESRMSGEGNGGSETEPLNSIDRRVPNGASGRVVYSLGSGANGVTKLKVRVKISGLPARTSRLYRFWVIDDFVDDWVLVKTFRATRDGKAAFKGSRGFRELEDFRRAVVTLEAPHHRRERPDGVVRGPIIMEGAQPLEGE